jgi:hypothetical protein
MRSKPTATGSGKDAELSGDDEVCKLIVDKFEKLGAGGVNYADIAKRAWEVGRAGLATKVRREPSRRGSGLMSSSSSWITNLELQIKFLYY